MIEVAVGIHEESDNLKGPAASRNKFLARSGQLRQDYRVYRT